MRVLHEHRAVLHGVMDVFLREPLLDWRQETMPARRTKLGTSDQKGELSFSLLNGKVLREEPAGIDPTSFG